MPSLGIRPSSDLVRRTARWRPAADGTETLIADLPGYDGCNTELVHWAVMDSSGNVWMILDITGQAPVKQYYVEVSPGGAVKTFPFTVPGDTCRYR